MGLNSTKQGFDYLAASDAAQTRTGADIPPIPVLSGSGCLALIVRVCVDADLPSQFKRFGTTRVETRWVKAIKRRPFQQDFPSATHEITWSDQSYRIHSLAEAEANDAPLRLDRLDPRLQIYWVALVV